MPHVFLSDFTPHELQERYGRVRYVFTDLDGTMMGPGSCVLKNAAGEPSLEFATALVDLARAGIEVIPCSGRNRSMLHEDTRVLGLNSYIGEMGGLIRLDREHNEWESLSRQRACARSSWAVGRACSSTTTTCRPATSTARSRWASAAR